jgi:hypothetical protein
MKDSTISFIQRLPPCSRSVAIKPRCKTGLSHHFDTDGSVWVVLLTEMPGKRCQAWHLSRKNYYSLEPKHGSRDRFVREHMQPVIEGEKNPPKPMPLLLF